MRTTCRRRSTVQKLQRLLRDWPRSSTSAASNGRTSTPRRPSQASRVSGRANSRTATCSICCGPASIQPTWLQERPRPLEAQTKRVRWTVHRSRDAPRERCTAADPDLPPPQLRTRSYLKYASPLFAAVQAAGANVFKGVETAKQEKAYLKSTLAMLETRVADLGEGHSVVSVNALDAIERQLQEDSDVREAVIAKSEEWKKGDKWKTTAEEYRDMDDGSVARYHPHLMRPAAPGEERDLRVGLLLYGDEVEVMSSQRFRLKYAPALLRLPLPFRSPHPACPVTRGDARHDQPPCRPLLRICTSDCCVTRRVTRRVTHRVTHRVGRLSRLGTPRVSTSSSRSRRRPSICPCRVRQAASTTT